MLRYRFNLSVLALVGLMLSANLTRAATDGPSLAVVDFAYVDTSGEPADQTAAHQKRLQAFMAALRQDLGTTGFRLVPVERGPASRTTDGLPAPDLLRAAREAGATIVVAGGIHKQSTLVQWAKVQIIESATGRVIFDRLYTFRGDSDDAWARAETFVSREIRAALDVPGAHSDQAESPDR